jgi:hypothetical protein
LITCPARGRCQGRNSNALWAPGSVPGCRTLSVLFRSLFHLVVQPSSTPRPSRSSHCSIGCPIHFSTHCFRAVAGWLVACCLPLRVRSCVRIAAQASLICLARPVRSSRAWKRAILPFNQRSSGGTYASVSSCRIGVALKAPSTWRSPLFWCFCSLAAGPAGPVFPGWCQSR